MTDWGDPLAEDEAAKERERRRAERDARRRERDARRKQNQGALGDRVKDVLQDGREPGDEPVEQEPAAAEPPSPEPPAQPPPPPRGPGDVRRRRRVAAVLGVVAAGVVILVVALAVRGSGGGDTSTHMTTQVAPSRMLVIPEGYDRRQISAIAKDEGLKGDYMKASEALQGLRPGQVRRSEPVEPGGLPVPGDL